MLRCLFILAQHHGVQVSTEVLQGAVEEDKVRAALRLMRDVGLTGKLFQKWGWDKLAALGSAFPVMAEMEGGYWVIIVGVMTYPDGRLEVAVLDPRNEGGGTALIPRAAFEAEWAGRIILCKRKYSLTGKEAPFGIRWFMPQVLLYSRHMLNIAGLAFISSNIALMVPLFFNILIDKVVPHQSYNTLDACILIFLAATIFDGIFNFVRQGTTFYISNKIDAYLSSRTFEHMLSLPLPFFERVSIGTLIRHMQQAEVVRGFLVGSLFNTMLDLAFMPMLLLFLALYSARLTAIVLVFSMVIAGVIGFMIPIFARKLDLLYQAESDKQTDLVETIHGMRTVKSLAIETLRRKLWDSRIVGAIRCRTSVTHIGIIAGVLTTIISQSMTITVLSVGVVQVFDGSLSVGALVAFAMLSQRVTQPLLQVVHLINQYQQVALSVTMLGEVMNHPSERASGKKGIMPTITGKLEFDEVIFSYPGSALPALNRVSFRVEEGQVIGIVGRSGSGKTTVTRMVQGIHAPQEGLIRLNGNDIRHFDLTHLRRNIGVVLQDSFLFRGTIRDNIAVRTPDAPQEAIMNAARMAGADEFIERLPRGYGTWVDEGASNFSGGQRQRIAIARALLAGPNLLIFDEATSALDPDSEAIIQQNLDDIARGRTMIVVSHRLSSLVKADGILVLERGVAVDFAPHGVLLERCDIYRHLWHQQNRHLQ